MEHDNPQIFVSYNSNDKTLAYSLVEKLEAAGHVCWIAPRNMRAGEWHDVVIPRRIAQCDFFLILLSHTSKSSHHVHTELAIAFDEKCRIIPLFLAPDIPEDIFAYFLKLSHRIPYTDSLDEAVSHIRAAIENPSPDTAELHPSSRPVKISMSKAQHRALDPGTFSDSEKYNQATVFYKHKLYTPARNLYLEAAAEGNIDALCALGNFHRTGDCGFPVDPQTAFSFYLPAARAGNVTAQYWVGFHHLCSNPPDLIEATKWFQLAAQQGHATAQEVLADLRSVI